MKNKTTFWFLFLAVVMGTGYVGYSVSEVMRGDNMLVASSECEPEGPDDGEGGDGPGNGDSMPSKLMAS